MAARTLHYPVLMSDRSRVPLKALDPTVCLWVFFFSSTNAGSSCVSDALRQSKMNEEKFEFVQRSLTDSLVLSCGAGSADSGLTVFSRQQPAAQDRGNATLYFKKCQSGALEWWQKYLNWRWIYSCTYTQKGSTDCCCVLWGHRATTSVPCWLLCGRLGSVPIWTTQNDSQQQNVVSSLSVQINKSSWSSLKLPVALGAGSLLRPYALQEDTLCSEHSGENLWQHQRAACCFYNLTSNETQASCTSAITAASLGGEPTL